MNFDEFNSVISVNPPLPEPKIITDDFATMLIKAGLTVRLCDPVVAIQTIKRAERFQIEISSFKVQDLSYFVDEIVKYGPDIVFLREVKEHPLPSGIEYIVRINLLKVELQ